MEKNKNLKMIIAAIVIFALGAALLIAAKIYEKYRVEEVPDGANIEFTSIKKAEKKLNTKIPVLESFDKKLYRIEVNGKGWPWHADVYYSKDAKLEMAKKTNNLVIPSEGTLESARERKDVGPVSVEYISENESSPYRKATWRYHGISYAFQLSTASELNIEDCVKEIIDQIVVKYND